MAMPHHPTDDGTQVRRTVDRLAALDGAGISRHQIKIMFVSGMGFLADAYDLFVIGIVVSLLKTEWVLSTSQVSWLNSATLAASAVGALVFGNTISSPEVLRLLSPHASLLHTTLLQLAIFVVFALPGYVLAIALLDKAGRRSIQLLGFGMMGAMFLLIGLVPGVTQYAAPFVVLYGVSYFFTEFGPNTTTFVYPAELFPVQVRTTGHGISAALGKMGAFAGAFLFPVLLASSLGIRGAEVIAALVSLAGLALTAFLLPEPRGKSLEELSAQAGNLPGLTLAPATARAHPG